MASVTLAESAKLCQDELLAGVIETIVTVDELFDVLPFMGIDGNALAYNRENAAGDVQVVDVGDSVTAKAAATFTQVTSSLTTIIGDAEVNGLIQATRSNKNDQTSIQIASKAKSIARKFQDMLINGTGGSGQFSGILTLMASGQKIYQDTAGVTTDGGPLSFAKLDELIDLIKDKNKPDVLVMNGRTLRSYRALLRAAGGAGLAETMELPQGRRVLSYGGIPILRNDWIPVNQTRGALTTATTVLALCFDDGSGKVGISGMYPATMAAGIDVANVGVAETKDEVITRVKWYTGLANFSTLGVAGLLGVSN
jgi:hypothetical protein